MVQTGMTRPIDNLGRVVIPSEIRKQIGLKPGSKVEIFIEGSDIVLRRFKFQGCAICGQGNKSKIAEVEGIKLCESCLNKMLGQLKRDED